jgi:hypothetical protein
MERYVERKEPKTMNIHMIQVNEALLVVFARGFHGDWNQGRASCDGRGRKEEMHEVAMHDASSRPG